jgi:hypothetical protein
MATQADLDTAITALEAQVSGLVSGFAELQALGQQVQTAVVALQAKVGPDLTTEVANINSLTTQLNATATQIAADVAAGTTFLGTIK